VAKRKKHEEHEEHVNHERWLITYADMITLLMVLFIVLFAIGQTDLQKFKELAGGTKDALGGGRSDQKPQVVTKGGNGILQGGQALTSTLQGLQKTVLAEDALSTQEVIHKTSNQSKQELQQAENQIQAGLLSSGVSGDVHLQIDPERGLVVTIVADRVLFDEGQANLRPEGQQVLNEIAPVLGGLRNPIEIEGHTDNLPISSATFPSNWELSTGRAGSVLRYLASKGVDEKRMKAAGYADTRPIASNANATDRQKNRRVEIVVLSNEATAITGASNG
jgi:chemotaxis protein MotB